jgi:hypothetical protein
MNSPAWTSAISFNKPLQPHHAHAIALRGCIAELQFRPESPHHPRSDKEVEHLFKGYEFSSVELEMMSPYCDRSNIKDPHEILDIKYYTGTWGQVLKEARVGRYRDPKDTFRFHW